MHLVFYTNQQKQKKKKKQGLNPLYTLQDIQSLFDQKDKKNLSLYYQVIFDDESVFPELLKKLPNKDIIPQKLIPRISKRVRKIEKPLKNSRSKAFKCQRSIFSNHGTQNNFFNNTQNSIQLDTVNVNTLNSKINEQDKNSFSFLKNSHFYQNSNTFQFNNFSNINYYISNFNDEKGDSK